DREERPVLLDDAAPSHRHRLLRPHDAQQTADAVDDVEVPQIGERALHGAFPGRVGNEDQTGILADALLLRLLDGNVADPEHARHSLENAGLVGYLEGHVVLRRQVLYGTDARLADHADTGVGAAPAVGGCVD